jgi:hypothetical protein
VPDDHAANDAEAGAVANITEAEIDLSAAQADFDLLVLGGKRGHVEGGAGSGLFRFSGDDFGYNHVSISRRMTASNSMASPAAAMGSPMSTSTATAP